MHVLSLKIINTLSFKYIRNNAWILWRKKGQKKLKERRNKDFSIVDPFGVSPKGPILTFCSSEIRLEGKDQTVGEKE